MCGDLDAPPSIVSLTVGPNPPSNLQGVCGNCRERAMAKLLEVIQWGVFDEMLLPLFDLALM